MRSRLEESIRRLEATLVREGGHLWRKFILEGATVPLTNVRTDLPPLTPDLRAWFSWRSRVSYPGTPLDAWRSLSWAIEQSHRCRESPAYPPTLIPFYEDYLVDVTDGALWQQRWDDDGIAAHFARSEMADPADLLDAIAQRYVARRDSPWRRRRIELRRDVAWTALEALPDAAALSRCPTGSALLSRYQVGLRPKALLFVKLTPEKWIECQPAFVSATFDHAWVEHCLADVRNRYAACGEDVRWVPEPEVAQSLARQRARWIGKGGWNTWGGLLHVWEQPGVEDLLARLERLLSARAPATRRALSPPATSSDLAALEKDVGRPLPPDVRSLYALADGQFRTGAASFYWNYTLMSTSHARSTMALMQQQLGLASWDRAVIPFLDRHTGDFICVDVAGAYGPEGCIVAFDHDNAGRRRILFESVTQWIECFVDGLENGIYVHEEGTGIFPRGFMKSGDLEEIARHDEVRTNGAYPWETAVVQRD